MTTTQVLLYYLPEINYVCLPCYRLSGSQDTTIRAWCRRSLVCMRVLSGHTAAVTDMSFDGTLVTSCGSDRYIYYTVNSLFHRMESLHTSQTLSYIPARHYLGMTDQVENVHRCFTRHVYQRCQLDCNHHHHHHLYSYT